MCVGSEERAKRVSDARSQRSDKYRQDREKQQVMLQLHQQQVRAEAETAALAAAQGHQAVSERRPSPVSDVAEERNLVVVIKADVQVSLLPLAAMASHLLHTQAFAAPPALCAIPGDHTAVSYWLPYTRRGFRSGSPEMCTCHSLKHLLAGLHVNCKLCPSLLYVIHMPALSMFSY